MNTDQIKKFSDNLWDSSILQELMDYIKIPCKSPLFDKKWQEHGYLEQAMQQFATWAKAHAADDMHLEILQLPNRTPLLFIDIPGATDDTILLYGHMDKQPEMTGWDPELGPWKPVLRDDKLYGRGGADDGYALFASLTAILALQQQNIPHARCVIIIEACEESGSYDLPVYIDHLKEKIGSPSLVICLDSGAGNYEQLWSTTSLRGTSAAELSIEILTEGVHSGVASGVVPGTFRILRQLLSRIENEQTGELTVRECHVEIPEERQQQAKAAAEILGDEIYNCFPFVKNAKPTTEDLNRALLLKTWYPTVVVTGIDGVPACADAGNVLRPYTRVTLSFRFPPTCDADHAMATIEKKLTENPPYNAKVTFTKQKSGNGWNAPALAPWLEHACAEASTAFFGLPAAYMGEGGSIPFMGMLGKKFPQAQFLITGVLGPHANAHGPNEFLQVAFAKKLTCCVAYVIAKHFTELSR
jgi:acetylornithine deacetylase/succinyl-diaminopimelate desuccinylase-like protein